MTLIVAHIIKPLTVAGNIVTARDIANVIDAMADAGLSFTGMDLVRPLPQHGLHWKQEVMNRLMQRWRKLDLVFFDRGRWSLTRKAWPTFQSAVLAARTS